MFEFFNVHSIFSFELEQDNFKFVAVDISQSYCTFDMRSFLAERFLFPKV